MKEINFISVRVVGEVGVGSAARNSVGDIMI
jgi:hypothetical protein